MKKQSSILFILILCSAHFLFAQDFYLPVSSKSEAAKSSYHKALKALEHANLVQYGTQMQQAMKKDPNFLMAYAHLALGLTSFKEYEQAQVLIRKGLAINQSALTPAEQIMRKMMVQLKKDPEANPDKYLDELVAEYPQTPQAYELRAIAAYWISNDKKAALRDTKKLLKLSPNYAGGYNMLGYNYMAVGNKRKAKKAFETYIRLAPDKANAYDSMGDYFMYVKDYARSAEQYNKATALGMKGSRERAEKARSMISE